MHFRSKPLIFVEARTELKLGAAVAISIDKTDTVINSSNKVNPRVISQILCNLMRNRI